MQKWGQLQASIAVAFIAHSLAGAEVCQVITPARAIIATHANRRIDSPSLSRRNYALVSCCLQQGTATTKRKFQSTVEARGADASGIERVPLMPAGTRPEVFFAGRPAAEGEADTRIGRIAAFV